MAYLKWFSARLGALLASYGVVMLAVVWVLAAAASLWVLRWVYRQLRVFCYAHNWSLLYLMLGILYQLGQQCIWLTLGRWLCQLAGSYYLRGVLIGYVGVTYKVVLLFLAIRALVRFLNSIRTHFLLGQASHGALELELATWMLRLLHGLLLAVFAVGVLLLLETPLPLSPLFMSVVECLLAGTAAIVLLYLLYVLLSQYGERMAGRGHFKRYIFLEALYLPLMWLVVGMVYVFSTARLSAAYLALGLSYADVLLVCLFWTLYRGSVLLEEQLLLGNLTEQYPDKGRVQTTGKVSRIVIVLLLAFFFLLLRGYETGSIPHLLGGSALGIGLAAREIIANYLSGAVIYMEGKFKVGEWIYSADGQVQGTIEYIGLRSTDIRTFDKRLLTVPNSFFSANSIVNASRMTHRRISETIPVERMAPQRLDSIIHEVRLLLQNHPGIDPTQLLMVHFSAFGESALNVHMYAFTKTRDWKTYRNVQQDVFLKTIQIVHKHGGALAFPTRTLQLAQLPDKTPQADPAQEPTAGYPRG